MADPSFSHLDGDGKIKMVDVTDKEPTRRTAEASAAVITSATFASLETSPNGFDPIFGARLAGIQAAKRTANLIPLCHPLTLHDVQVHIAPLEGGYEVRTQVVTVNRTGVEMEALTACSFAALALVSSLIGADPQARFEDVVLLRKSGGRSGDWGRMVEGPQ